MTENELAPQLDKVVLTDVAQEATEEETTEAPTESAGAPTESAGAPTAATGSASEQTGATE